MLHVGILRLQYIFALMHMMYCDLRMNEKDTDAELTIALSVLYTGELDFIMVSMIFKPQTSGIS